MPGGFHPFHAGHASLYQSALKAFPDADVYVAATNDTKTRPFPFAIKEKLAKVAGVKPGRFVQVKSPFKAEEITSHYNPSEDVLIFVRSEKDKNEQPKPGGTKKDGSPSYFQPWTGKNLQPFSKHAYMAYLPTVEFGPGITSATEIRNAWPTLNDKRKTAMVMSLYPATQSNPKLADNVVKLLDMGMGGELAEEFRPSTSQAMNIRRQTSQKMNPGTNKLVWKRPNQIGGSYTENELRSMNFKYSAKYNVWGGTQQMWDRLTNEGTLSEGPFVQRITHPKKVNIYLRFGTTSKLVATDIPYEILDSYIKKVIQKYPQFKSNDFSFRSSDKVDENLGIPYPTTYEQENNKFKRTGAMRITDLTEFAPPSSDRGDSGGGENERSRRLRKLLEIAIRVAEEQNVGTLDMIPAMNKIAGDDFFSVAVKGILPDITNKEYMFVIQSAYKTVKQGLTEFAPPGGGDDREPNEEILRKLAAQWWNGTEQQMIKAQRTLNIMGWEIGQDESGDDDAGVFVIKIGDINGDSYIAFPHSDLGLNEDYLNEK